MKIAVADKDQETVSQIKEYLVKNYGHYETDYFLRMDDFLENLHSGSKYEIVIFAMEWGEERDGFFLAEEISKYAQGCKLLFMEKTADPYVQQAFLMNNHGGFLLKPISNEILKHYLEMLEESINQERGTSLILKYKGDIINIDYQNLFFLEGQNHRVELHTSDHVYITNKPLYYYEKMLPTWFVRCHKGFIVNVTCVKEFTRTRIVLKSGNEILLGRKHYDQFRESYFNQKMI